MKVIAIGDVHGRGEWEKVYNESDFDKFVFIGDYFDSHDDISGDEQVENFKRIMEVTGDDERVIHLLGNHDLHYLIDERYSGYQQNKAATIMHLLSQYSDKLKPGVVIDDVLYTHAGLTTVWANEYKIDASIESVEEELGSLWRQKDIGKYFGFQIAKGRFTSPYGDDPEQGPMWVRPNSLVMTKPDYWMVVGHSAVNDIRVDPDHKIALIDCGLKQYLEVVNGNHFNVKEI